MKTLVFDLEIKKTIAPSLEKCSQEDLDMVAEGNAVHGWKQAHTAGISSGVTYDIEAGRYTIYGDTAKEHRILADAIESADRVIGFNHINFDYHLLAATVGTAIGNLTDLDLPPGERDIDLLQMAWAGHGSCYERGFSLDALTKATLGDMVGGKNGHGEHAPQLYQAGLYGPLLDYNLRDVELTWRLFEYMNSTGYLLREDAGCLRKIHWRHPAQWFPR